MAIREDPGAIVWRGNPNFSVRHEGVGRAFGMGRAHNQFLEKKSEQHDIGLRVLSQVLWSGEVLRWKLLCHATRVSTNVMVRYLDLSQTPSVDGRRLEVVVEGLSLFGGAQLAIDATLVST